MQFEKDTKACGKVKQLAAILKHSFRLHTEALNDPHTLAATLVNNKHVLLDMFGALLTTAAATPVCNVACIQHTTDTMVFRAKRSWWFESMPLSLRAMGHPGCDAGTPFPEHHTWGFLEENRLKMREALQTTRGGVGESTHPDSLGPSGSAQHMQALGVELKDWKLGEAIWKLYKALHKQSIRWES
jgi:hypothetical protein